jgi:hypothetical protein
MPQIIDTYGPWFTKPVKTGGKPVGLPKSRDAVSVNHRFFFKNSFQIQKIEKIHKTENRR